MKKLFSFGKSVIFFVKLIILIIQETLLDKKNENDIKEIKNKFISLRKIESGIRYWQKIIDTNFDQKKWDRDGKKILKDIEDFKKITEELEQKVNVLNSDKEEISKVKEYLKNNKPKTEKIISNIKEKCRKFQSSNLEDEDYKQGTGNLIETKIEEDKNEQQKRRNEEYDELMKRIASSNAQLNSLAVRLKEQDDLLANADNAVRLKEQDNLLANADNAIRLKEQDDLLANANNAQINIEQARLNIEQANREIEEAKKLHEQKQLGCPENTVIKLMIVSLIVGLIIGFLIGLLI